MKPTHSETYLPRAIVQAIELWTDERYARFLHSTELGPLDKEWFAWFQGEWRIGRTISRESKEEVRIYLEKDFKRQVISKDHPSVVDDAAQYIRTQGWSVRTRNSGSASLPLSFVSKIGFLFSPKDIVPCDLFARTGLSMLQGKRSEGGIGLVQGGSYTTYLKAFDAQMERFVLDIEREISRPWTRYLAERLECPAHATKSEKFRRKVFDNFLMLLGGWKKPS